MTRRKIPKCKCCGAICGLIAYGDEYVCGVYLVRRIWVLENALNGARSHAGSAVDSWIRDAERSLGDIDGN